MKKLGKSIKLFDIVQVPMSKRQRKIIKRIDSEDCEMIIYLTLKHHKDQGKKYSKEYYEAGCLALKQYYATSVFDRNNMHAISTELDPFWHSHILDTVAYKLLCDDIDGFMHHDPLNKTDKVKIKAVREIFKYTNKTLIKIFGEKNLDKRFFPKKSNDIHLVCLHDLDNILLDDVFEVNPKIEKYRLKYGHGARKELIKKSLKKFF